MVFDPKTPMRRANDDALVRLRVDPATWSATADKNQLITLPSITAAPDHDQSTRSESLPSSSVMHRIHHADRGLQAEHDYFRSARLLLQPRILCASRVEPLFGDIAERPDPYDRLRRKRSPSNLGA